MASCTTADSTSAAGPRNPSMGRFYTRLVISLVAGLACSAFAMSVFGAAPARGIPGHENKVMAREPRVDHPAAATAPKEHVSIIRREPRRATAAPTEARPQHWGSMMRREYPTLVGASMAGSSFKGLGMIFFPALALIAFVLQFKPYVMTLLTLRPAQKGGKASV